MKKSRRERILTRALLGFLLLNLAGCKLIQPDRSWSEAENEQALVSENTSHSDYQNSLDSIAEKAFKADLLHLKFNGEMHVDDDGESFSGTIKLIRDSVIEIKVVKFGYSFAKVLFTKNQLTIINRKDKTYQKSSYAYFSDLSKHLNFDLLQNTLLQNQAFLHLLTYQKIDYQASKDFILGSVNFQDKVIHKSKYNDKFKLVDFFIKEPQKGTQLLVNYRNYKDNFARNIVAELARTKSKQHISLEFYDLDTPKKLKIKYKIPSSYRELGSH